MKRSRIRRRTVLHRGTKLRARGGDRFPAQRDADAEAWMQRQRCAVCRAAPPSVVAHVVQTRAQNVPVLGYCVPLCGAVHEPEYHWIGRATMALRYGLRAETDPWWDKGVSAWRALAERYAGLYAMEREGAF